MFALKRWFCQKCTKCNRSGATLGCCASNCHSTYHFGCALQEKCGLFEDKRIFCQRHLAKGRTESVEITDFSLIQKRSTWTSFFVVVVVVVLYSQFICATAYAKGALLNFDPKTSLIRCGSATLRSLGQITNATIKTAEKTQQLVPVGLTVVRIYWSCHKVNLALILLKSECFLSPLAVSKNEVYLQSGQSRSSRVRNDPGGRRAACVSWSFTKGYCFFCCCCCSF